MAAHLHPSLVRLYRDAADNDTFLYIDESYSIPDEYEKGSFYILSAVKLRYADLDGTRESLRAIADSDRWHTTEELRTSDGKKRTVEMLEQLHSWGDEHFISVEIPLPNGDDHEKGRGDCLRALVEHSYRGAKDDYPSGLIFEKRLKKSDDDRDRHLIKALRAEGLLPKEAGTAWVSPSDEQLLWAPDITCMSYRRQITHREKDETGKYFETYLEQQSTIIRATPRDK